MPGLEATIAADGTFEFPKVLPGAYRAQAFPANDRLRPVSINVVRDIEGLKIAIPPEFEVRGRFVVEQDGPVPRFSVQAISLSGNSMSATANNGIFRMILPEGTYRFTAGGLPAGYSVHSMKSGSAELLSEALNAIGDAPIPEVVVTIGVSNPPPWRKVSGRVIAPPGSPLPDGVRVALAGEFGNSAVNVKPDSTYEFSKILPGGYRFSIGPPLQILPTTLSVGDKDIAGFDIRVELQVELSGRINIEGGASLPTMAVNIARANGAVLSNLRKLEIRPPGVFTTMVTEGEYRVTIADLPAGYILKSMTSGSVDLIQGTLKVSNSTPSEVIVTISGPPALPR